MLDNFVFENHLGIRFDGLENGVYLNHNDLRDYSWSCETVNSRSSRFFRSITKRKIPLIICCESDEEAVEVKNRLMELTEADIDAVIPGTVYVGEYYTHGYITASKKSDYLASKRFCKIELTLTSDDPSWYSEETFAFPVGGTESEPDNPPAEDNPDFEGIVPSGTIQITENGTFDVIRYAFASVNVESATSKITVSHDGKGNVTLSGVTAISDGYGNITVTQGK